MKTLALVTLMMPLMAFAKTADDSALAAKLKRSEQNLGEGVIVKTVDKKYVDEAIIRVGGKATVEFGPKDQLAVGGVIVGSGADGLASRSNSDPTSPIVIRPPVIPQTSITVVGKPSHQLTEFCAFPITMTASGEILTDDSLYLKMHPGDSNRQRALFQATTFEQCATLNKPLRLKAGTYMLTFNNTFALVQLGNRENKVIPLREIAVPNCNCDSKVQYTVYRDFRSTSEVSKVLTLMKLLSPAITKEGRAALDPRVLAKEVSYDNENFPGGIIPDNFYGGSYVEHLSSWYASLTTRTQRMKTQTQGTSTFVLPGTYSIEWNIDGQLVYTPGIRID